MAKRRHSDIDVTVRIRIYGCAEDDKVSIRDQERKIAIDYIEGYPYVRALIEDGLGTKVSGFKFEIVDTNAKLLRNMLESYAIFLPEEDE